MIRIRQSKSRWPAALLLAHLLAFLVIPQPALAWEPPPTPYNQDESDDYDYGSGSSGRPDVSVAQVDPDPAGSTRSARADATTPAPAAPTGATLAAPSRDNWLNPATARWIVAFLTILRR